MTEEQDNLLALDPGRRKCGWAIFQNGTLFGCGVLRLKDAQQFDLSDTIEEFTVRLAKEMKGLQLCKVSVVERMRIYPGRSKGDLNHLLDIQAIGAALGAKLAVDVRLYHPQQWKGNVKKEVTANRLKGVLSEDELSVLQESIQDTPKQYHSDISDAVAIGVYHLRQR